MLDTETSVISENNFGPLVIVKTVSRYRTDHSGVTLQLRLNPNEGGYKVPDKAIGSLLTLFKMTGEHPSGEK